MSKNIPIEKIVDDFVQAALSREITSNEPWNHGWSQESYRRSSDAAVTHDDRRSVRLSQSGLNSFEEATGRLLKLQSIRQIYDNDEFWELTATLVGTLPLRGTAEQLGVEVSRRVDKLLSPLNSLVMTAVANVAPPENVLNIGALTIGTLSDRFKELVQSKTQCRVFGRNRRDPWWISDSKNAAHDKESPVVMAYVGRSQLERAINDAGETFEDLISIALMLQPDLDSLSLYSLRGDASRPGLRGLVVDRNALAQVAQKVSAVSKETACRVLVEGSFGERTTVHWYGEDPFPLEKLLAGPGMRSLAERLLLASSAVDRRLRVAARWHAKAHWAFEPADAVLALGISFDSMLSETGPTAGRVLSERFALLDPDSKARLNRYRQFQTEYYPARSSVAHGAKRESLDGKFVRGMAKEARWTFRRILELTKHFEAEAEDKYQNMWELLRWNGPSACPTDASDMLPSSKK